MIGEPCPDENALVGFVEGHLSPEAERDIEAHLDRCPRCHSMLSELAEVLAPPREGLSEPPGFGRYELDEELGLGGMGVVYAAHDRTLGRRVALKLVRPDLDEGEDREQAKARLLREARLLASLSHPHVLTVFDVGTRGDDVFLAAELIEGETLQDWAPARPDEAVDAYRQAALGLHAAHRAGLVHRDVKPANLIRGHDGRVRVTDFGLAVPHLDAEETPITRTGAIVGTPAYMAPEQLAGRNADARTDQYALCVSLAEALTGVRPIAGSSREDLAEAAREHGREMPDAIVLAAVAKGLSARPEARHESLDAFVAALSSNEPSPEPKRRNAAPRPWGWLVAVGLAGALGFAVSRRPPSPVASVPSNPPVDTHAGLEAPLPSSVPVASVAPNIPASVPLSSLPARTKNTRQANDAYLDATRHHDEQNGAACLTALAEGARLDPARANKTHYLRIKAQCMMMNGDCAGGRALLTRMFAGLQGVALRDTVDAQSTPACRSTTSNGGTAPSLGTGAVRAAPDVVAEAQSLFQQAQKAKAAGDPARCRAVGKAVDDLVLETGTAALGAHTNLLASARTLITQCLAATDCAAARTSFEATYRKLRPGLMTPADYDEQLGPMFESAHPECRGK